MLSQPAGRAFVLLPLPAGDIISLPQKSLVHGQTLGNEVLLLKQEEYKRPSENWNKI